MTLMLEVSHIVVPSVLPEAVGRASAGTDWAAALFWAEIGQAVILAVAGGFAYNQVRQARLSRQAQYRPYVIVYAELSKTANTVIQIIVENIGATPARDIKFTFSPELQSTLKPSGPTPVPPWSALENGVKFLAPGQKIVHLFDSLIQRYSSALPHEYEVSITYHSKEKERLISHNEKYDINFGDWYGSNFQTVYTLHDVAESLRAYKSSFVTGRWTAA